MNDINIERKIEFIDNPSWSASFEDIGKQLTEILNEYKDEGYMIEEIRIKANSLTEIHLMKVLQSMEE